MAGCVFVAERLSGAERVFEAGFYSAGIGARDSRVSWEMKLAPNAPQGGRGRT